MTSKALQHQPRIWDYPTTRDYVEAYDQWALENTKRYTRRAFARRGKVNSPNYIGLVIAGKRKLHATWAQGFAFAAKLEGTERTYLDILVQLENTSLSTERDKLLSRLHHLIQDQAIKGLASSQIEIIQQPEAWSIYHLLSIRGPSQDLSWFKNKLRKKMPIDEIRKALKLLIKLDLIKKTETGYERKNSKIKSPDQLRSAENRIFHRYALAEAREALEEIPIAERNFGSLTIAVGTERTAELQNEVNRFGQMLLEKYGSQHPVAGELFRLNVQLYPLTEKDKTS